MHVPSERSRVITRRRWLLTVGAAASWPLVASALGCGVASINAAGEASLPTSGTSTPPSIDTTPKPDPSAPQNGIDPKKWATGGTKTLAARYADPFGSTDGDTCAITCQTDPGTCTLSGSSTPSRQDISEDQDGLPMRVVLRLLDSTCQPVENARVELWHASPKGLYSGKTDNKSYCSNNDDDAIGSNAFRGVQTSDDAGLVTFDSCFPGWTQGRTVHLNLSIKKGSQTFLITQLAFADAMVDGVIATQPIYRDRGSKDTNNAGDPIISGPDAAAYVMDAAQMADGCMLAFKTLTLRARSSDPLCSVPMSAAAAAASSGGNTILQ